MSWPLLAAAIALYLAWGCAALAMDRHWKALVGSAARHPVRRLRWLAAALAALAAGLCLWRDGAAFGLLLWSGLLCVSVWMVVLTLAWRDRRP
ncbi:DUF3325 family protein [Xylophilus rhododendri]|uniref:DUF3325 family protein n=1 Tax=Xylophilus rhododendri TaxID=2697032 RepID=A0A857JBD8_9BURK|nr:DUF3325 domain-containing protein [Xylophilus rhododendri]QHJ00370.1 DUF3325 family protein [Xylophilus rhododendri]